jgi:hypothetical protein
MDWGKLTSDVTQWGEKAKVLLNEAGNKAQEKIEEAKLRTQPPITVGPHRVMKIRKVRPLRNQATVMSLLLKRCPNLLLQLSSDRRWWVL